MMPWVHLHVTQLGTVTPCCQAPWTRDAAFGDINEQSVAEIWNGAPIRAFRRTLLSGGVDPRCARCHDKERSGLLSLRQITNADYAHRQRWVDETDADGASPSSRPVYVDIRFSNLCNFRCRICGPASSSRWAEDGRALGQLGPDSPALTRAARDPEQLWKELARLVDTLEEIYFAGGEPLVMEEHYALLDLLLARGRTDVRLKYNTNLSETKFRGRDVLADWARFKNVIVSASLDGSGARGELQRKGQIWAETVSHARRIRASCPHVLFQVTPTVSLFNLLHLPSFHREWTEAGLADVAHFWPSVLSEPARFNIRVAPATLRLEAHRLYAAHLDWMSRQTSAFPEHFARSLDFWRAVLRHLDSADQSHRASEFALSCRTLDAIRNENTAAVFPELRELLRP